VQERSPSGLRRAYGTGKKRGISLWGQQRSVGGQKKGNFRGENNPSRGFPGQLQGRVIEKKIGGLQSRGRYREEKPKEKSETPAPALTTKN